MITYSLIIPVKDEEENIIPLLQELTRVMEALDKPWEVIVVDDGSTDSTLEKLIQFKSDKIPLRILVFAFNAGQSSAFDAGFKSAKGEFVITLDGDGQNDPSDIPRLIQGQKEGFDLVVGSRVKRNDPLSKRILSKLSNYVRSRVCKDGVQDTGCSLKLYRKSCLNKIKMYQGMHRFLPALFALEGFSVKELPVNHRKRKKGASKYHFFQSFDKAPCGYVCSGLDAQESAEIPGAKRAIKCMKHGDLFSIP